MEKELPILKHKRLESPIVVKCKIDGCESVPPPYIRLPEIKKVTKLFSSHKKVKVFHYFALSKKGKRIYTEKDAIPDYGCQPILDPCEISYTNLFINGVLQPKQNYYLKRNCLFLKTVDTPIENAPIVLQMIQIR